MFAIITPALITGAFANRVDLQGLPHLPDRLADLRLLPVRAHDLEPGRPARQVGRARLRRRHRRARIAGFAALASVLYVGRRPRHGRTSRTTSRSIALGTGLLWFGWYGFNAGSGVAAVDSVTASAFLNTDVAASFAAVTWLFVEWANAKQPKFVGLLTGAGRRPRDHHPRGRLRLARLSGGHRHPGRACCATTRSRSRTGWAGTTRSTSGACTASAASLERPSRCFRQQGLEPGRRRWVVVGRRRFLYEAMHCRYSIGNLGLRLYLRRVVADRSDYAGQARLNHTRTRSRRRRTRRGSLYGRIVDRCSPWAPC